jgi:hypothetical protein
VYQTKLFSWAHQDTYSSLILEFKIKPVKTFKLLYFCPLTIYKGFSSETQKEETQVQGWGEHSVSFLPSTSASSINQSASLNIGVQSFYPGFHYVDPID